MASRSLNKVLLIGNLTRDPELRYTPQGTAVCTLGLATNRQWTTDQGEKREEAEFHTIVAWNRLAEICAEFLKKGRGVYVEGRISSREWEAQDGTRRKSFEIVANEVIFLGGGARSEELSDIPADLSADRQDLGAQETSKETPATEKEVQAEVAPEEKKKEEDIPF